MALIPEHVLQEIRERVDMVELVGESVQLKRTGKNFVGLCPFHREKTPSFNVSPERQIFKCFGCGVGGDALVFLMSRDNLEFPEAARRLATRAGIELPQAGGEARARWQPLYEANAFATEFYERALRDSAEAAPARAYLDAREVGAGPRETFRLGWAPAGWDGLLTAARAVGLEESALVEAGLVSRSERTQGLYDRFRSRVVFPILDPGGRVVGFSGRLIAESDAPKYLNSPESPVFKKGALLFGLALSKNSIRQAQEAVVVEGNFDLLSLYDRGLTHAVAPLGTSLTPEQALLLKRYASRAVLLYDSDEAGLKAAFRSGDELLARGFAVRVAFLPAGADPDTFVRREGATALRALLRDSPDLIAAKLRVLRERLDLSQVEAQRRAIDLLLRSIRRIPDPITRELQVAHVAGELGLDRRLLAAESRPARRPGPAGAPPATPAQRLSPGRLPPAEKYLLLVLLKRPEYLPRVRPHLVPEDLTAPASRRIYELLLELDDLEQESVEQTLMSRSDPEMQSVLAELWLWEESLEAAERIFQDTLAKVKELAKERELAEVRKEGGESETVWRLAREKFGLEVPGGNLP
jgi:DNA primase